MRNEWEDSDRERRVGCEYKKRRESGENVPGQKKSVHVKASDYTGNLCSCACACGLSFDMCVCCGRIIDNTKQSTTDNVRKNIQLCLAPRCFLNSFRILCDLKNKSFGVEHGFFRRKKCA